MTSQLLEPPKPATLLLAEDDRGHARLVERNLRRAGVINEIVHVCDGHAALDFVLRRGKYADSPANRRILVLLDLNIPVMDGYEVLKALKSDTATRRIPIVVLTTTDVPEDVQRCYDLGCNVFISKPVEFDAFAEAVRRVGKMIGVMAVPQADH